MNILMRRKASSLLQKSTDAPLSPQEKQLLQDYLETEEGQNYAKLHQQLTEWQPGMDDNHFDHQHLRQATRKIDQEVQRKRRTRRNWRMGQTVMGVTAVIALIIVGISWIQVRQQVGLEPTLSQPIATATPPVGMKPVDLRSTTPLYNGRTIAKAEESANFPLHLPTWLVDDIIFKAADYYPKENSVEILAAQKNPDGNWGAIWILSQAKLKPETTTKSLPTFFNPFSTTTFDIEHIIRQEITKEGEQALYEQEFWSISNGFYGYNVSRLSWETDEKRFFLTIMEQDEYTEASTMVELLTNMRIETP